VGDLGWARRIADRDLDPVLAHAPRRPAPPPGLADERGGILGEQESEAHRPVGLDGQVADHAGGEQIVVEPGFRIRASAAVTRASSDSTLRAASTCFTSAPSRAAGSILLEVTVDAAQPWQVLPSRTSGSLASSKSPPPRAAVEAM
jgi:hypothetical protein